MNPMKKFLAILLGASVILGATFAFADDSATSDDGDEVSVEQQEAPEVEGVEVEDEADAASLDAPGQQVATGDLWTGGYARGLEVATIARGEAPAGYDTAKTSSLDAASSADVHGSSADHGPTAVSDTSDSEG